MINIWKNKNIISHHVIIVAISFACQHMLGLRMEALKQNALKFKFSWEWAFFGKTLPILSLSRIDARFRCKGLSIFIAHISSQVWAGSRVT